MTDKEKLPVLLEHWIEHNASHREEFEKWGQRADAIGQNRIAADIFAAAAHLGKATECLRSALNRVRPGLDLRGEHRVPE